jgi:hypothetical protein
MAWIESHQELGAHPKTLKLARKLGNTKVQAVGHLQYLWWWATDYAQDGDLSRYESLDIAIAGEWEGDADTFVDGLVRAGFLEQCDELLSIHDWDEYAGRLIERRAKNAQRMREARAAQNPTQDDECDERAAHVQSTHDARARLPNQTKPNHTEPNLTKREHTARSAPARVSYPDDFEAFWKAYPKGHGAKDRAYDRWRKLSDDDRDRVMARLPEWHASQRWREDKVKDCAAFLTGGFWDNPPPARVNQTTNGNTKTDRSMAAIDRVFDRIEAQR